MSRVTKPKAKSKTLTQRVAELEAELADMKSRLSVADRSHSDRGASEPSFVDSVWGVFRDDPAFVEAMKLGREYRESLRPENTARPRSKNARPRH
jgi:hypothetical protein